MIRKRMKYACLIALGGGATVLSGCASLVAGTTQPVSVNTMTTTGADCNLVNAQGKWELTTPGTAVVKRSKTDVKIRCTKDGFQDAEAVAPSGFEPWTLGNLLFGGLIGIGVDFGTGAIHRYPDAVAVPMAPAPGVPSASLPQPPPDNASRPTS